MSTLFDDIKKCKTSLDNNIKKTKNTFHKYILNFLHNNQDEAEKNEKHKKHNQTHVKKEL